MRNEKHLIVFHGVDRTRIGTPTTDVLDDRRGNQLRSSGNGGEIYFDDGGSNNTLFVNSVVTVKCDGFAQEARGGRKGHHLPRIIAFLFRRIAASVIGVAATLTIFIGPVSGGERWSVEFDSSPYFFSADATPVEVILRNPNDHDPLHRALLHVPRAAIVFANFYDPAQMSQVPDRIDTNDLRLAVTYPDGRPLSIAAKELAEARKISFAAAVTSLRAEEYSGEIGYSAPDNPWEARVREELSKLKIVDTYDGLLHADGDNYLGQAPTDAFVHIFCYPEATPTYFCKTKMRISPSVVARVDFSDFRFRGGRSFANERARKFRSIVCSYVEPQC